MNVVLIDTACTERELSEPLGIETLAAELLWYYSDCNIDTVVLSLEEELTVEKLKSLTPSIIGISTKIGEEKEFNRVISIISSSFPKNDYLSPLVVVGDVYGTYAYEYILNNFPSVICVIGEGEEAWVGIYEIYSRISSKEFSVFLEALIKKQIPNIAFYKNGIHLTRRSVKDLTKSVYRNVHIYSKRIIKNNGIIRMEASRGCPWNECSFCVLKWNAKNVFDPHKK